MEKVHRLILANQYYILSILDSDKSSEHLKNKEIVEKGFEFEYIERLLAMLSDETPTEISTETYDILNMFRNLDEYIKGLSEEQLQGVDVENLTFKGFDANNDKHYHYMQFIVENGEYKEFGYRHEGDESVSIANSHHSGSIDSYRRILERYTQLRQSSNYRKFTVDDLKELSKIY